ASGNRRAHAPYSSAALAANAFGRWLGDESDLSVAGLGGFDAPLSLEHKLRIAHRGGTANLDCLLTGPAIYVGVESKLTETFASHDPVPWRPPYLTDDMSGLLSGGWREALRASIAGEWTPMQLGLEQLVKHALALSTHAKGR